MKRDWYHESDSDGFHGIRYLTEREANAELLATWGPFKTFAEAKRDAIGYFKCDLDNAKHAIADIRKFKKVDCAQKGKNK